MQVGALLVQLYPCGIAEIIGGLVGLQHETTAEHPMRRSVVPSLDELPVSRRTKISGPYLTGGDTMILEVVSHQARLQCRCDAPEVIDGGNSALIEQGPLGEE